MAGIIAPRTYRPGDLIYEEKAFALALFEPVACATCHKRSPDLRSCTGCRETKYCSRACQKVSWLDHKLECEHLKNLTEEYDRYFVRLLGKVILKIKDKDWKSIQVNVVDTNVTFDDIGCYDTEREGHVKCTLFSKRMKELTRKYIGEQNMPTEDDFDKILGKMLSCNLFGSNDSAAAGFVFLGLSKFEGECIPNTYSAIRKDVLKIWACKEIRKGSEKITVKTSKSVPEAFAINVDTMNNKCKCTDCTLPYGESVQSKIVDESRALAVICETENLLNRTYSLSGLPFTPSAKQVDELLKKQEEVLGDTNILRLKLLHLKCFKLGDHPYRLKDYFQKYEESTRKVYGEHSMNLESIYTKYIDLCFRTGDALGALCYMDKLKKVNIYK